MFSITSLTLCLLALHITFILAGGISTTPFQSLTAWSSAPACVQSFVAAVSYTYLYKYSCYYGNPAICLCTASTNNISPSSTISSLITSCATTSCTGAVDAFSAAMLWSDYCVANVNDAPGTEVLLTATEGSSVVRTTIGGLHSFLQSLPPFTIFVTPNRL
jgi:hypothetical protein